MTVKHTLVSLDMRVFALCSLMELHRRELVATINSFLETLPPKKRNIFICRYWYSDSVSSIARRYEMTESNVSVTLNRLRSKLKEYLSERGYVL